MDLACDHIQEDVFRSGEEANAEQSSLNDDLQGAYRAFSASPWGARIGGFLGNVVKQGGSVYSEAQHEFSALGQDASKGLTGLRDTIINRTRSLSIHVPGVSKDEADAGEDKDSQITPTTSKSPGTEEHESTVLEKLRREAAKRLHDIQRAEDAADEALLKFGISVRDFFREAISIAAPSDASEQAPGTMLFESKDAQGKRVIHASRYDAQLHVAHTSTESFKGDPAGEEYVAWARDFDVEKKTEDIASDLGAYPELRDTMEAVVPDQVSYVDFWKRYYFLRHGIETAEARRRDLLKAASAEDDVKWDDDEEEESSAEDDEDDDETDDEKPRNPVSAIPPKRPMSASSSTTIQPPPATGPFEPAEARKLNDEKSVTDSDTSYDIVGTASGVASQAPDSPKGSGSKKTRRDSDDSSDDSSDEDWE